jgi:1,4-alpha-glucan branching enzyme
VPPPRAGAIGWREALNTDAAVYGGAGLGAMGATLAVEPVPTRRHDQSLALMLPPLATVFLVPVLHP